MITAAIVLVSIGMLIMLSSLGWGIAKVLSWRSTAITATGKINPKPQLDQWLPIVLGIIGIFLVGQLFFDAGGMFYLGYLTGI